LFTGIITGARAQKADDVLQYIETYKDIAIAEMIRTGVPASITLAQGIHESGAGRSELVRASNNHFGIKCKSNWTGESVRHDDDAKGECFRKYPQAADSYRDHSDFLRNGQRYAFLFQLSPFDYEGWANGLKKAGYATNPKYPQVLIRLINDYNLQQYTQQAMDQQTGGEQKTETAEQIGDDSPPPPPPPPPTELTAPEETVKYPEGKFMINGIPVVYAKKGTSYFALAVEHQVDLAKIFDYNEIPRAEATAEDQLVFLQQKRKSGAAAVHVVQPGETLHTIAQQEGIRLESLLEYNGLQASYRPVAGEKLRLQKK